MNHDNRISTKHILVYAMQYLIHIFVIKLVWNSVLVRLFPTMKLPQITLWQAWSISLLASMLLGGNRCCAYVITEATKDKKTMK